MAIIHRLGEYKDFYPSKMRPAELAVVQSGDPHAVNGRSVYMCFVAGVVKQLATYEDMEKQIADATVDIRDQYIAIFTEINEETEAFAVAASAASLEAKKSQLLAADSATEAMDNALLAIDYSKRSESFAHGNTGVRPGEDTDNSKYYSEQSQAGADRAAAEADRASVYAEALAPKFVLQDNRLYMSDNDKISFIVKDNRLYFKLVA